MEEDRKCPIKTSKIYICQKVTGAKRKITKNKNIGSISKVAILDGASRECLMRKWHLKEGDKVASHLLFV